MNVYRIRLQSGSDVSYKRFWAAETLIQAAEMAFKQWCEESGEDEKDQGAVSEFQQNFLQGADFIGELENG